VRVLPARPLPARRPRRRLQNLADESFELSRRFFKDSEIIDSLKFESFKIEPLKEFQRFDEKSDFKDSLAGNESLKICGSIFSLGIRAPRGRALGPLEPERKRRMRQAAPRSTCLPL
jgi:hypothetical protein